MRGMPKCNCDKILEMHGSSHTQGAPLVQPHANQIMHTAPSLPHAGMGLSFFFSNTSTPASPPSVVSELRSLPVLATVLVSQGNIPESAHGLAIPVWRRPWTRDEPLSFFGTLATYVFRAVQVVQQ
mgnify:CR=1 FL=1